MTGSTGTFEYAVQLKIDDMELLLLLEHAYQKTNHELEQKLVVKYVRFWDREVYEMLDKRNIFM